MSHAGKGWQQRRSPVRRPMHAPDRRGLDRPPGGFTAQRRTMVRTAGSGPRTAGLTGFVRLVL
jgi:hypothetical protein